MNIFSTSTTSQNLVSYNPLKQGEKKNNLINNIVKVLMWIKHSSDLKSERQFSLQIPPLSSSPSLTKLFPNGASASIPRPLQITEALPVQQVVPSTKLWMHEINQKLIKIEITKTIEELKNHINGNNELLVDQTLLFFKTLIKLSDLSEIEQDVLLLDYAKAINNSFQKTAAINQKKLVYCLKTLLFSTFSFKENFTYLTKNNENLNDSLKKVIKNYQNTSLKKDFSYELDAMMVFLDNTNKETISFAKEDFAHLLFLIMGLCSGSIETVGKSCQHLAKKVSQEFEQFSSNNKLNQVIAIETYHYALIHSNSLENKDSLKIDISKLMAIFKALKEEDNLSQGLSKILHTIALYSDSEDTKKDVSQILKIEKLKPTFITQEVLWESKLKDIYDTLMKENPLFFSTLSTKPTLEEIARKALSQSIQDKIVSYMGEEDKELYSNHFCRYLLALKKGIFVSSTAFSIDNLYIPLVLPKENKKEFSRAYTALTNFDEESVGFKNFVEKLTSEIRTLIKDHSSDRYSLLEKMDELNELAINTKLVTQKDLKKTYDLLSEKRLISEVARQRQINGQIRRNFNNLTSHIKSTLRVFFKSADLNLNQVPYIEQMKGYNVLPIDQFFGLKSNIDQEIENQKILYVTTDFHLEKLSQEVDNEINQIVLTSYLEEKISQIEFIFDRDLFSLKNKLQEEIRKNKTTDSIPNGNGLDLFDDDLKYCWGLLEQIKQLVEPLKKIKNSFEELNKSHPLLVSVENFNVLDNKLNSFEKRSTTEYTKFKNECLEWEKLIKIARQKFICDSSALVKELLEVYSNENVMKIQVIRKIMRSFQEDSLLKLEVETILKEIDCLIVEKEKEPLESEFKTFQKALEDYLIAMELEISTGILNEMSSPFEMLDSIYTRYVVADKELEKLFNEAYSAAANEKEILDNKLFMKKELDVLKTNYESAVNELDNLSKKESKIVIDLPAIALFLTWNGMRNEDYSLKKLQKHYIGNLTESAKRWETLKKVDDLNAALCEMINYGKAAIALNYEKTYTHTLLTAINMLGEKTQEILVKKINSKKKEDPVVQMIIDNVAPLNRSK